MTEPIINAAPMSRPLGIRDVSGRETPAIAEAIPQHLPKSYIFAKWGPITPQLVVGNARNNTYHVDSFDYTKKWANHATVINNIINAAGNSQMVQRVLPDDAGPRASMRVYVDIVDSYETVWARGTDGMFLLNGDGNKIDTGEVVLKKKIMWVTETSPRNYAHDEMLGQGVIKAGNQIGKTASGGSGDQSRMIPVFDFEVPHFGENGNNFGIRIWAPTEKSSSPINPAVLEDDEVASYPYRFAAVYRETPTSTPKVIATQSGEFYLDLALRPGALNRKLERQVYVGDRFIQDYQLLDQPGFADTYGPFGDMYVYEDNIAYLQKALYDAEYVNKDEPFFADMNGADGEEYRINMVSAVNSQGQPYYSIELNTDEPGLRLTESTNIFAGGGYDGTLNLENFDRAVASEVAEYANPLSTLLNTAENVERIIYDSGFSLATKYELIKFISQRKDTFIWLSTHIDGEPALTASEESSLAVALRTRLQMYPESDYFATSTVRGLVMGRSGRMLNSTWTREVPITMELASKAASYMGAGNGRWTPGQSYDHEPGHILTMFGKNVNVRFTPSSVRNKDWANGLNWVQSYTRSTLFVPALKTAYDDDTSVLSSFFTAMACCEIQAVAERAWRAYSGVSSLTNGQLKERVEKFILDNTNERFDGRFVIQPEVYFTEDDLTRGYSWHLVVRLYANNMKTVQTMYIEAHRMTDLDQTA